LQAVKLMTVERNIPWLNLTDPAMNYSDPLMYCGSPL
jgi:hypothetical protein